jgi:NodT family efflux transporter outer membrane factor (OMF) lipoprotein
MVRRKQTAKKLTISPAVLLAAAGLAACSFTPDVPPSPVVQSPKAQAEFVTADVAPVSTSQPEARWWRLYDNAELDGYVARALEQNNDLKAALANLDRVLSALGENRAAYFPSTEFTAGATYERQEKNIVTNQRNKDELAYKTGFSLSYEIDLFGRVSGSVDAARADAEAAAAALHAARITVAGETARAYADICAANQQITVTENTFNLQARTVDLTRQLTEGGQGTTLDIVRAQVNVENTRASLPRLRAARENARFRLATLVGVPPAEMIGAATDCDRAPIVASTIPVGDGAGLIARRPDVQEAEMALAASASRVGVAVADLYPRITLGGSVDLTAFQVASVKEDGALGFDLGPLISWTFPNQKAGRARIAAAEATMAEALARFDQAVLVALQETETALQNYAAELERQAALAQAREAAAQSAQMARERYELGADDFITVLDAERTLAEADITLAQSQASTTQFQIELFRALGGTWDATDITTASIEPAPTFLKPGL